MTLVDDRSTWTRDTFPEPRAWVRRFEPTHLDEIDAALDRARRAGVPYGEVTPEDFPLDRTRELVEAARAELETGPGFAVLAGFPVERYDDDAVRLAYCGLTSHLGRITPQTHLDDRLIDVTDRGKPYDHTSRGYHSNKLLPFHTDGADYVGLLALGMAAEGGLSVLCSASAVYEAIKAERPDVAAILEVGFHHHRRGEERPGEPPVSPERIPVFSFHDGLLHAMYNRNPIMWARDAAGYRLTDAEVEAMDFLDSVMARPEMQLWMDLQVGDIQYVNNLAVFHSRTEFRDDERHVRHLLRVWVTNDAGRRNGPTLLDLYAPEAVRRSRTAAER